MVYNLVLFFFLSREVFELMEIGNVCHLNFFRSLPSLYMYFLQYIKYRI